VSSKEKRRILYVMGLALAVLLYSIGMLIPSLLSSLLTTFAIVIACIVCGFTIDDYNSRTEKPSIDSGYLRAEDTKLTRPRFRSGTGSGMGSGSGGQTPPITVDADLSLSTTPSASASQTRNLLDAAVASFDEGAASNSTSLIKEASRKSPYDPVVWAALTVIHVARNECEEATITNNNCIQLDKNNPTSILATSLFEYSCLRSSGPEIPEVLEVPSDNVTIEVDSHKIPTSARIWWEEGYRQLKKSDLQLALRMFQAALIEFQQFPQAWEGVAFVYGLLEDEMCEKSALIGKDLSEKKEEIPEYIWKDIGLMPRSKWLERITLYRIIYGSRFRLPVL
jgi:hypothetical protein